MDAKTPAQSQIETRYMVMPQHANPHKTLFGGQLMAWIDSVAAMVATRHSNRLCVTVSTDRVLFRHPVHVGDQLVLRSRVNYVGRTSMEIGVSAWVENPKTGEQKRTTTAYLTFVALDDEGRPTPVPPLEPTTESDQRRYENAKIRVDHRRLLLERLKREEEDASSS